MLTKKVTDDDNFMSLSASAQALYLHLNMSADDDGFNNQVTISMFKAHASIDDLKSLLERRYIYQFENGVIVIKHWRMANALRKDRYTPTAFQEELKQLNLKDNGSYSLVETYDRKTAYKMSDLPYSFDYKIRQAFWGKKCPICNCTMSGSVDEMGIEASNRTPTIQHNKPLSKGGKHELGNISVICKQCNITIQDKETGELNAKEVIDVWNNINGCHLVATDKDRLDKNRIGKDNVCESKRFTIPTIEQIQSYIDEKGYSVDAERFFDFYESKGWMVGKNKMKDWKACVRTWQSKEKDKPNKKVYTLDEINVEEADISSIREKMFSNKKKGDSNV